MEWFLYDNGLRHERVKDITLIPWITYVHPTILKNVFMTYVSRFSSMAFLNRSFENFKITVILQRFVFTMLQ